MSGETGRQRIRSFVLRAGRMTDLQRDAYANLGERYRVDLSAGTLSPEAVFGRSAPLVCEIGFGMGVATAAIALAQPERDFLGIEVHRPGVGKLMAEIEAKEIRNLRVAEGDAVEILERNIAPGSLSGIHLFFPDPWPKKKHHKRRIIREDFIELAFSRLRFGGYFYMVTDWEEYAQEALGTLSACRAARNAYQDFAPRRDWRPVTKFEKKAERAGRAIRELYFVKA